MDLFIEIAFVMVLAFILSIIAKMLKQPVLIAYLLTGVSLPLLFGGADIAHDSLNSLSQMGIAFLLFIVGINLDLNIIKRVGTASLIVGILQMVITSAITFMALQFFQVPLIPALFLSVALSYSSTAIVVKLLLDKGDIEKLYGQLALGILIVQDIFAVLALLIAASLSPATSFNMEQSVLIWGGLVISLFIATMFILPVLMNMIARSQELLFVFTIGWCFAIAALFHITGMGIEIGALVAGLSLSTSAYHYEIAARVKPLRDFFLIIYFFSLGAQLSPSTFSSILPIVLSLSLITILAKIIITYTALRAFKYSKNVSFLSSVCLSQVSEFSFVLMSMGVLLGYVPELYLSVATSVGIITIAFSSYMIVHGTQLQQILFKENLKSREKASAGAEMILFGHNRIGYDLLKSMRTLSNNILVIDYNPDIVAMLKKSGVPVIYGDATDIDFLNTLNFSKAKIVLSTIPDVSTNLLILGRIKSVKKEHPLFMATAHKIDDAIELYKHGVDYVIMPHFLGGKHAASLIEKYGSNAINFKKEKAMHLKDLNERRALGHEHPTLDFKT